MIVEGKGWVTPNPAAIYLDAEDLNAIVRFARLLCQEKGWEFNNALAGFIGEAAFGKWLLNELDLPRQANFSFFEGGDGGIDVDIYEEKYQVKTRKPRNPCRIKRIYNAQSQPIICDIYVFVELIKRPIIEEQTVLLSGWIKHKRLIKKGRMEHKDYGSFLIIKTKYLDAMSRLKTHIQNRRETQWL